MRLKLFHIVALSTLLIPLNCYQITSSFKRVVASRHLQEPVDPQALTLGSKSDYRGFQRTPVWDLAYALAIGDLGEVEDLAKKHKDIIDTPEPKYGTTLLSYAIRNGQADAVQILLANGANPNVSPQVPDSLKKTPISRNLPDNIFNHGFPDDYNDYHNYTPVHAAVATSPKMVRIILEHSGDPNLYSHIKYSYTDYNGYSYTIMGGYSPLLYAKNLETLQLLVEAGGNIHHQNKYGGSLLLAKYMIYDRLDLVLYLLERGVDYKGVMSYTGGSNYGKPNEEKVPLFLVDELRFKVYGLDTKWYQQKIKIIRFLASQGIDYWKTPIPQTILNRISEMSKTNNWSERKKNEFISKY